MFFAVFVSEILMLYTCARVEFSGLLHNCKDALGRSFFEA